ncbi:TetR/AcrR family transcriptional regulator [Lysobacter enzymogenes]|jgi:AcrR family transcriptional regulator|uniref:TetR family transcriptional regulator n=1 Tax=Lysobacter enzymogenes TaxID=69 RepID=A0AAU9AJX5_LYSEN|nr:TetR/AcrR family transcriptional regulator [Lysobacter enzymogenes]BAV97585.1 TetR family transcriptional regulator [Lysobacter enzymogenes]
MSTLTATNKGAATREAILDQAYGIACSAGLEGLSIGPLAAAVGMSKSGVFAHFGSREDLQLAVLDKAGERFVAYVLLPALQQPRGLVRLRAIVDAWFDWSRHTDGGCVLLGAVSEYDDRPGALRDWVVEQQKRWRQVLAQAVQLCVETGELGAETDTEQLAFEIYGTALIVHHDAGLFGFDAAVARGRRALERLLRSYAAPRAPAVVAVPSLA